MSRVAKDAGVQRETLYRSFSEQGNPTFETLSSVLGALGMKIPIVLDDSNAAAVRGSSRLKSISFEAIELVRGCGNLFRDFGHPSLSPSSPLRCLDICVSHDLHNGLQYGLGVSQNHPS